MRCKQQYFSARVHFSRSSIVWMELRKGWLTQGKLRELSWRRCIFLRLWLRLRLVTSFPRLLQLLLILLLPSLRSFRQNLPCPPRLCSTFPLCHLRHHPSLLWLTSPASWSFRASQSGIGWWCLPRKLYLHGIARLIEDLFSRAILVQVQLGRLLYLNRFPFHLHRNIFFLLSLPLHLSCHLHRLFYLCHLQLRPFHWLHHPSCCQHQKIFQRPERRLWVLPRALCSLCEYLFLSWSGFSLPLSQFCNQLE